MARNGPPDDFHDQPTQFAHYGTGDPVPPGSLASPAPPPGEPDPVEQSDVLDTLDQEDEPTPWYRRPAMLAGWIVLVLILVGLIIFGISELIGGEKGTSHNPTTTTTTAPTTTTTTPTTTTTTPPSTSSASEAPPQQPPQQIPQQPTRQPAQQPPTHRHHLPQLPPVITIPEVPTVITVPPGLRLTGSCDGRAPTLAAIGRDKLTQGCAI